MQKEINTGAVLMLALGLFLYGFSTSYAAGAAERLALAAPRPNIVLILLDDAGYGDLGSYGSTTIQTPSLDQVAAEGMRFTQFYAGGASCSPTRAAILSGTFPAALGIREPLASDSRRGLPAQPHSLAHLLREQGYATGHIGKWHLSESVPKFRPLAHGFDYSVTIRGPRPLIDQPYHYVSPTVAINDTQVVDHEGEHLTEVLTDYAIDFISEYRQETFFLNLWHLAPHLPLEPPEEWAARFPDTDEGKFAALLSHVDYEIGRLITHLDNLGLRESTLLIITSDNGGSRKTHASNGALRGFKHQSFEGGIRVPAFVRWPGVVAEGVVDDFVRSAMDLLPTIADIAGVSADRFSVPGESFALLLRGLTPAIRQGDLFWEERSREAAFEDVDGWHDGFAVRQRNWKLVVVGGEILLFDMATDPGESTNLAASRPDKVSQLLEAYDAWRLAISEIPYAVARSRGGKIVQDKTQYFFAAPGVVSLTPHPLFNFHDGDFTFRAVVTPTQVGTPQVLVRRPDSWEMWLTASGKMFLQVWQNKNRWITLRSKTVLQANQSYVIAFVVRGPLNKNTNAAIWLTIDGEVEAQSEALYAVHPNNSPIIFGSLSDACAYLGSVTQIAFYNIAPRLSEL